MVSGQRISVGSAYRVGLGGSKRHKVVAAHGEPVTIGDEHRRGDRPLAAKALVDLVTRKFRTRWAGDSSTWVS
jgi:hypothetical protein